jgi:hypothetical protein
MIEKVYKCLYCDKTLPCILRIQMDNHIRGLIPLLCPISKDDEPKWELVE